MVEAVLWGRECKTVFEAMEEIVFEVLREMVSGLMKEISWVMTKHSWFHVLFLVVRPKVESGCRMAQMVARGQSRTWPWHHLGCKAPLPRQLWIEESDMMLEDSSPRSYVPPSQTRERKVFRMEALR
jgi:hypothetical protein